MTSTRRQPSAMEYCGKIYSYFLALIGVEDILD